MNNKFNQDHHGEGDNIGGNKTINNYFSNINFTWSVIVMILFFLTLGSITTYNFYLSSSNHIYPDNNPHTPEINIQVYRQAEEIVELINDRKSNKVTDEEFLEPLLRKIRDLAIDMHNDVVLKQEYDKEIKELQEIYNSYLKHLNMQIDRGEGRYSFDIERLETVLDTIRLRLRIDDSAEF